MAFCISVNWESGRFADSSIMGVEICKDTSAVHRKIGIIRWKLGIFGKLDHVGVTNMWENGFYHVRNELPYHRP